MLAHAFGASEQLGELLGGLAVISSVDLVADAVVARSLSRIDRLHSYQDKRC
jgi:hypothetical protein